MKNCHSEPRCIQSTTAAGPMALARSIALEVVVIEQIPPLAARPAVEEALVVVPGGVLLTETVRAVGLGRAMAVSVPRGWPEKVTTPSPE